MRLGRSVRIDPRLLEIQHSEVMDGDLAYWIGGVHALLGERERAIASEFEAALSIAHAAWMRYRQQFA